MEDISEAMQALSIARNCRPRPNYRVLVFAALLTGFVLLATVSLATLL